MGNSDEPAEFAVSDDSALLNASFEPAESGLCFLGAFSFFLRRTLVCFIVAVVHAQILRPGGSWLPAPVVAPCCRVSSGRTGSSLVDSDDFAIASDRQFEFELVAEPTDAIVSQLLRSTLRLRP